MSEIHDPFLGRLRLIDDEDGEGTWEFEFVHADTTVNGSLCGSNEGPDPDGLEALRAVVRQPERYLAKAWRAIREMLDTQPDLIDLERDELVRWQALDTAEFARGLSWEWLRFSKEHDLVVLGFETDLDAEHGLGVGFSGQAVKVVDLRPHLL